MPNLVLALQSLFMTLVLAAPLVEAGGLPPWVEADRARVFTGLAVFTIGSAIAILGAIHLGSSFTIFPKPKTTGLRTTGLYRISRNPVYTGIILAGFGWSLAFASPLTLMMTVILLLVLRWKVSYEEKFLMQTYGGEFIQYREKVGRFTPWF